jgi:hypothetical protein
LEKNKLRSFDFAQDFGCGLALGYASLTPAERLKFAAAAIVSVFSAGFAGRSG